MASDFMSVSKSAAHVVSVYIGVSYTTALFMWGYVGCSGLETLVNQALQT